MKKFLLLCFSFVFVISVWAQERVVSGKVTSAEDGSSLPGVNVVLKGTTNGTVTDADGNYKLTVPASGGSLAFSFIGLASKEVAIGERNVIDVSLTADVTQLGEVVVTAQGVQQEKKALGYAVTTLNNSQIANRPEPDVSRILQGKIPGVNVTSTSGVSGTGTSIIIRGYSSVTGSNQPLFVVDGVPFNTNTNQQTGFGAGGVTTSSRMLDLDPNSIESVSVLKGLSATVLYGDQGRNGVILITTKAGGKVNKAAEITVSQSYYQNSIASLPDYQNNYGGGFQQLTPTAWFFSNWGANFADVPVVKHPVGLSSVAFIRNGFPEFAIDPTQPWGPASAAQIANVVDYENKAYPNIGKSFFRKGNVSNTSLQISGSQGTTGFNASVGYQKEEGFTVGNELTKLNLGLGVNSSLSEKFSLKTSFNYAFTDMITPPLNAGFGSNANGGIPSAFANVMYTPRNVDLGGIIPFEHPVDKSSVYYRGGNDITNPRWITKNYSNSSLVNRFFNSTSLNYDISEKLSLTYRVGLDTYTEQQEWKYNKGGGAGQTLNVQNGIYNSWNIKNTIMNHDFMVNFKTDFGEKLGFTALVGANNRYDQYEQFGVSSSGQVAFGLFNHSNFQTSSSRNIIDGGRMNFRSEQRRIGVYANTTLDFADFLFLNLSARNDWTSTVEEENRRILYPGASISFIPSTAFDLPAFIDQLKLRAGFGTSAGFPSPYNTRNILAQNTRSFLVNGAATPLISQTISNALGNPNLKPELQQELEFGLEGNFLKGRVGIDLSLYQRQTKDLITNAPIDPSTGFTSTNINIGEMETKGVDLVVNGVPFKTSSGLTWDVTWNFGTYRSKITDLGADLDEVVIAGFSDLGNFAIKGQPYGIIKGIGIERDDNGNKIVQPSGRYLPTNDPVVLGDPNPEFTTSIINGVSFKNFRLSFMFEYRHRGVIVSQTVTGVLARGLTKDTDVDRNTTFILPGVLADGSPNNVQISAANYFFDNYFFSDEAVTFDGSTIRLRELSLSYNLPKGILGKTPFKAASVSLTGSNLWFEALNFPKSLNFDTDVLSTGVGNGLGFDYLTGPSARRIGGTISLTF